MSRFRRDYRLAVNGDAAAIALTVFPKQFLNEFGIGDDTLLIAVIAVDEHHEMGGAECHLRTFVVTGGRANTAFCITVYGQACDVDGSSADALVRFFLTTNTQCERVAHELVCIKASDTVSESDGGEVHKVHEGVDLVEFLKRVL